VQEEKMRVQKEMINMKKTRLEKKWTWIVGPICITGV